MSSSEEAEFDDEQDESPMTNGGKTGSENGRRPKRQRDSVNYNDDDDDDDDDDDIPLAELVSSKGGGSTKSEKAPKSPPPKSTPTAKTGDNYQSASAAFYGSECDKGLLIQHLLCRWWYSIDWPDPSKVPDKPPKKHDSLDGFPGVFVCTAGDKVGQILDMRDQENAPTFSNFAKKSSAELKELLLRALDEQRKQLLESDGPNTETESDLKAIIKKTKKVKPETADRQAEKVLKAAKLKLPK